MWSYSILLFIVYYLFSIMLNIPSCKKMTNKTWPKPYVIGKVNNISQISDGSGTRNLGF